MLRPRLRLDWILRNVRGSSILDIGFVGGFVGDRAEIHDNLKSHNPTALVVGADIDFGAVLRFHRKDHQSSQVVVCDGTQLPLNESSFETVVLAEVVEHLIDPIPILREALRVLRERGSLLVTTPNLLGLTKLIQFARRGSYTLGSHGHVRLYDSVTLGMILKRVGFSEINCETTAVLLPIPFSSRRIRFETNFSAMKHLGYFLCVKAKK